MLVFCLCRHVFSRPVPISGKTLFLNEHVGFRSASIINVAVVTAGLITDTIRRAFRE